MKVFVNGVGLLGPGLPSWAAGGPVLASGTGYEPAEVTLAANPSLPAAERRRMTDTVKLAMAVGAEAIGHADCRAEELATVFASSGGDGKTITAILEVLASDQRDVSPTRFHNSVHNAPSGYWSIANHCQQAATSICAHDFSFSGGLLEAAALVSAERRPVLLVSYDLPYPPVLDAVRSIKSVFGIALVLAPERGDRTVAALVLAIGPSAEPETTMVIAELEAMRLGNPSARSLPLLKAIAGGGGRASMPLMAGNQLVVEVAP